ncbi:MAG TPA: hypothetical protein VJ624_00200 [Thermodesulfobacteriota bacterium]|nr:hypothetical protein [Thermodesulfobacteriota bacterium]
MEEILVEGLDLEDILLRGLMLVEGGEGFHVVGPLHPILPMKEPQTIHTLEWGIHTLGDMELRECLFLLHLYLRIRN